jgi:hypothetical protein
VRTFAPAVLFQTVAVRRRPLERGVLVSETLGDDEVMVLKHVYFDGGRLREEDASDVAAATPETPQQTCAGLDGIGTHGVRRAPF